MFSGACELDELLKSIIPFSFLIFLPLFIIISPYPVSGAHEFQIHRMHQFDLHGVAHGCRATQINLEARSLSNWSTQRHCVVARLQLLTSQKLYEIKANAGGLLIVLPQDMSSLSVAEKQVLNELELNLMEEEVLIPVYFATWSPEIQYILEDVENSKLMDEKASTALEAILNSISANGYQIVINANKPSGKTDAQITTIQSKLSGYGVEDKLPTIAIVAYYDTFGVAPELSFGGNSNGSGIIMLLELARIFSYLYASARAHARVNILFLLSGGGKLNFQGSKKWLEDQLDGLEGSLIQDAMYVLCLDSVGSSNDLNLHVSKPPKEGSPAAQLFQELNAVSSDVKVDTVHKKINLADDALAWEHERFSIRRLTAFTLSQLKSYKDPIRGTMFDDFGSVDIKKLTKNIEAVATALARQIYNVSGPSDPLKSYMAVDSDLVRTWLEFLTSQPRSAALLSDKNNPLVKILQETMQRYIKDTKMSQHSADRRDPEFVFYDVTKATVHIYNVKPAVFDLFLMILISIYLTVIYFAILKFPLVYAALVRSKSSKKAWSH